MDSVYFKVRNGTYTEQFEINSIKGANHKNSVIFEAESLDSTKVIVQYNSANYGTNYVAWLNNSFGTTFRKMTLQNNSTSGYRTVFRITNGSRAINFENNILQNPDSTSSNSEAALIYSEYNRGSNIQVLNNIFNRGAYALYLYSDYNSRDKDILIQRNKMRNQGYMPVYMYALHNVNFSSNTISVLNNSVYYGLYWYYSTGTAVFSSNKINIAGNNANYAAHLTSFYSSTDTFQIIITLSLFPAIRVARLYLRLIWNPQIYFTTIPLIIALILQINLHPYI